MRLCTVLMICWHRRFLHQIIREVILLISHLKIRYVHPDC